MPLKETNIFPTLSFTAFVLWLIALPMNGPLLSASGLAQAGYFFLPVHIVFLLIIGLFCPYRFFQSLFLTNCLITGGLALALSLIEPAAARYLLLPLGASSAFVAVGVCACLRQSPNPLMCAAIGLAAANLLVFALNFQPIISSLHFIAVALPLMVLPFFTHRISEPAETTQVINLWHYLPFIVVFKVICGLMYAYFMPAYQDSAWLPGLDLLFYIAAVALIFLMVKNYRDLTLVSGVITGMVAFTVLQFGEVNLALNLGIFTLNAAAGIIDLVLIAVLLAMPSPLRAFGIGLAADCTGIFVGHLIGSYFAGMAEAIVLVGHIILNLSVLTLYFLGRSLLWRKKGDRQPLPAASASIASGFVETLSAGVTDSSMLSENLGQAPNSAPSIKIPRNLRLLLSEREFFVLDKVISGHNYREIAKMIGISESSVKTYMQRIYEKVGVKGKKKLLGKLDQLSIDESSSD
ncbi:MAG: LuxR C-terminal-related transcriptional regulator [Bacteroidales bacterium]